MIGKNFRYNWLDMSPQAVFMTNIALSDVRSITGQTTEIKDNTNTHWSKASNTKEWGRLFIFEWYISGITKPIRWAAWRLLNERINIEPYLNADPYKKLEFQTDEWEDRWVMAKVNKKPDGSNAVNHPRIEFSFELFAETNEIYGKELKTQSFTSWIFGGTSFPNQFPDSWGSASYNNVCINEWNFSAWCIIQAQGELVNPKIKNLTNGQEFKIAGTTTNLILDTIWGKWWVTDEWLDIFYKREYGHPIHLSPWENIVVISDDNGTIIDYTVSWYDTRNTF